MAVVMRLTKCAERPRPKHVKIAAVWRRVVNHCRRLDDFHHQTADTQRVLGEVRVAELPPARCVVEVAVLVVGHLEGWHAVGEAAVERRLAC